MRHFLDLPDLPATVHHQLLKEGIELKQQLKETGSSPQILRDKVLTLLFQKPSTRTRVSFETGIRQMGGHALFISAADSQLSRDEQPSHTARVLSSMTQGLILRTKEHAMLTDMARNAKVPVINALSSRSHPCQLLADMMTFYERRGALSGKKVVWCGDGNNVCHSYIEAANIFNFQLHLCVPQQYMPAGDYSKDYGPNVTVCEDPQIALRDADLISTDVWISMGDANAEDKKKVLSPYKITSKSLDLAKDEVLFMHCLPAREGEEIEPGLLDDPRSAVWEQAENRLHSQKALLSHLFGVK